DVIRANYEKVLLADQFSEVAASNVKVDRDEVAKTVDKELYRIYQTNYLYLTKSNDNEELVSKAGDTAARLKTMEECLAKAQGGTSLADIQKEYADILVYATRDFQRVNTSNIEPDYVTAVLAMKKGDIQLYETSYGIYVIELVDDSTFYGYEDAVTAACELESNRGIKAIYDDIEKQYKITYTEAWDEIKMGTVLKAKQ
ncbi:MAG: peptidylprolyl isomerase, partial [Lachnospiraceae bacterium]|nr:peptidylprolyl isomerase [Lachnospiraceae bacterium]